MNTASVSNLSLIHIFNNSSSAASGYPNTTVAQNAVSYGGEAGYNISSFFNSKAPRIYPFIRYEYYNPMEKTEANTGLLADKMCIRDRIYSFQEWRYYVFLLS